MYSEESKERDNYYRSQGYTDRNTAYNTWVKQNPNASYSRKKQAKYSLKYNASVNGGLLMRPEDF